ncbi:MAG TPA: SUMF1/EgtB/PvdO family nonheme iron enzyme [Vicinamibacterales bacterium]|jgi:ergothioneine biosynthesis protein EgtB
MPTMTRVDATAAAAWYRRNRARSAALFDMIDPSAYYTRPIALRNPIVFYEGHLPAFSVLAFLQRGLGRGPIDVRFERLFERGIDPDSVDAAVPRSGASTVWPARDEVRAFGRACDEAVIAALADLPAAAGAIEGLYTALEHEAMHQETLLYMWHRLPYASKRAVGSLRGERPLSDGRHPIVDGRSSGGGAATLAAVVVPDGDAVLGADRSVAAFGWDNEFDRHVSHVPSFEVDAQPTTNAQFLEFLDADGYRRRDLWSDEGWDWIQSERVQHPAFWLAADPSDIGDGSGAIGRRWLWRGMFSCEPLPSNAPVYVSHAEASAYAAWKGRRLITEAEWHRAAEGATMGHADFAGFDPVDNGSFPGGASLHGVQDLVGNGWEWTSTIFGPFDGFAPMRSYPEYSADFFDGRHYVMKGASPATARELIRPSFRNWFRGNYPYVYAKFRTARG